MKLLKINAFPGLGNAVAERRHNRCKYKEFHASHGLDNSVMGRWRLQNHEKLDRISMYFLVWVMLWWGGAPALHNHWRCMEFYAFPGLGNAVVRRRWLQNH